MARGLRNQVIFTLVLLIILISGCSSLGQIPLNPGTREQLKSYREILIVHYHPLPALLVNRGLYSDSSTLPLEDPLLRVIERFSHDLSAELGISSFRMIEKNRLSRDISVLKMAFGTGMVIDFDTTHWWLNRIRTLRGLFINSDMDPYALTYEVRARLIRLDDSKILWQNTCFISDRNPQIWGELEANDFSLLKKERLDTADACAQELIDYFLGRATQSFGTGHPVYSPSK